MAPDIHSIKSQFPIFSHHPKLVYLDNAATSQKPRSVIDAITSFYESENANIQRGLYPLSSSATKHYESVRKKVADFIGASDPDTIAFTSGTTESINIVAQGFLRHNLTAGDNVVISAMEHHANLIPWQKLCDETKASLKIIPVHPDGQLDIAAIDSMFSNRTKLVAVTHISNVLGTINPVEEIISAAHKKQIPVLVDAAQSVGHYPVDVKKMNVDFLVFSAHKMFGPTGTGVLFCKKELHNRIEPLRYGGGAIRNVTFDKTELREYPYKIESGTPNISGVIGMGAAIDFMNQIGILKINAYTTQLISHFIEKLKSLSFVRMIGIPSHSGSIVSLEVENIHPHDVAGFLAHTDIAVRAGHHCAQPLLESLGIHSTVRFSFAMYNTDEDIEKSIDALVELKKFWS